MNRYNPERQEIEINLQDHLRKYNLKYIKHILKEVNRSVLLIHLSYTSEPGKIIVSSPRLTPEKARGIINVLDKEPAKM